MTVGERRAYGCLLIAVVAWGLEYPLITRAAAAAGFLAAGAVVFCLSTILLGIALGTRGSVIGSHPSPKGRPREFGGLLLIGCVSATINGLVFLAAETTTTVNLATLARTDVLFSLILSALVFRERMDWRAVAFVPLMVTGTGLLTGFLAEAPELGHPGDLFVLASAFLVSLNAFLIKWRVRDLSGLWVGFANSGINALFFVSAALIAGRGLGSFREIPPSIWAALAAIGLLAFAFFATYNTALRTIPVWKVRLTCLAAPAIGALFGWMGLGDPAPTGMEWLGMLLVCAGAAGLVLSVRFGSSRAVGEILPSGRSEGGRLT